MTGWIGRVVLAGSLLAIAWFYVWTVFPDGLNALVSRQDVSYYNLLARGLLKGQLSLDTPADPALALMENPYDPVQRSGHGMHDVSYYQGNYYIYFGVTPVLLLFLPFHAITGSFVTERAAILGFSFAGFLLGWLLFTSVVRRSFPRTPWWLGFLCLWVLGLANMVPVLLRRPGMWEVPISCAYALFMLTLYLVWRALNSPVRARWILVASLTMGLAVGARPTYLLASVVLLTPWLQATWAEGRGCWRRWSWWRLTAATVVPIALVGLGLALYNHLRFGSPFEFGDRYQLAGSNQLGMRHFVPEYIPHNLWIYFLAPPGLTPYFPFLTVIDPPSLPGVGKVTLENPYGLLPGMPWIILVLPALVLAARRRGVVGLWVGGAFAGVGLTIALLSCFVGVANRYQVEFAPGLTLLGVVGAVWLADCLPVAWRRGLAVLATGLAIWSCGFNVLVSLQHNRLLALNHPALYAPIAHFSNHLPHWLAQATGNRTGPVELRVVFPKDKLGTVEPLVVTGHQFLADYLFVHYLGEGLIRFGFEHTSRGSAIGPATRIDPDAEHTLVVQMGSLHPPVAHPAYDGMSPDEVEWRTRTVKVLLNGRTVLHAQMECYDASDWQPTLGTSGPNRPGFKQDFSGRILSWRRLPPLPSDFAEQKTGRLHLVLRLPPFTQPRSEPLLSTGQSGQGDLIYITYLDAAHYRIGHDHWGHGGTISPPIGYDPNVSQDIDISCPPLTGRDTPSRLTINVNGSPLIDEETPFYPSTPGQIVVGQNRIGATTAEAAFSGEIQILERLPE